MRSHVGGLSTFYLDALLGLVPLRVHGAQAAIRTQHESLLVVNGRAPGSGSNEPQWHSKGHSLSSAMGSS